MDVMIDEAVLGLTLGLVEVRGIAIGEASPALSELGKDTVRTAQSEGLLDTDARKNAVRQLLRYGGFKPSGRNKPAQEYLQRTVLQEGELPRILNAVDVINHISFESSLPISLISLSRTGEQLLIRYGKDDETYVFNRSGQELKLKGLLCICCQENEQWLPVGNPVKDSVKAKVANDCTDVVAAVYAPSSHVTEGQVEEYCHRLADLFTEWCGADTTNVTIQHSTSP